MSPRTLVTCSRTWRGWSAMRTALTEVHERFPDAVLVHGDNPRGDRQAAEMWQEFGGEVEAWPAQWKTHGRAAGFIRNAAMVKSAPIRVLAFLDPESPTRGAYHCAQLAEDAGIPVVRYEQGRT